MSIAKFTVGRRGMSGRHTSYITRESACRELSFYNLEDLRGANDYENRVNAIAHAYTREDVEMAKGGEKGRTHYKLILSWDRREESTVATEQAHQFLKENFSKGRGFVAVHQDTEQTHVHVWLDARGTDGRKLHLPRDVYKQLDERWTRAYDKEYGTNYAPEYAAKKEQTREWKRGLVQGREIGAEQPNQLEERGPLEQGGEKENLTGKSEDLQERQNRAGKQKLPPDKPERVRDELTGSFWREKELRDAGVERNGNSQVIETAKQLGEQNIEKNSFEKNDEESRARGNQQSLAVRNRRDALGERAIESGQQQLGKADREITTSEYRIAESQQGIEATGRTVETTERAVSRATDEFERGGRQNERTKQAVRELQPTVERVAERKRELTREQEKGRERDLGWER